MTAIITIAHRASGAVHVLTDAAAYDANGMAFTMPKVWALPHLPAVLVASGAIAIIPFAVEWICARASSYESARARLPEIARDVDEFFRPMRDKMRPGVENFILMLAGIDHDGCPDSVVVPNHDFAGQPAFKSFYPGDLFMMPAPGAGVSLPARADELDPVADGVRLMEAQREVDPSKVGGFCQLTSIRATGIETKIIHRFDD